MGKNAIILGANGRFGRAAITAFGKAGWQITAFARRWENEKSTPTIKHVAGNAANKDELLRACKNQNVIINALNPLYKDWADALPGLTANVISAAKQSGATIMFPGNVYNFGNQLPSVLTEETPQIPNTKKARLRIEMEETYRAAADDGVQTIILRSGDFIEGKDTGNWFEAHIANKVSSGVLTYPGPLDVNHAWAYLPDMAHTMAMLAEKRGNFNRFEEFGFAGLNLTGRDLADAIEVVTGRPMRIKKFPWVMVYLISVFSKQIREVIEMRYLWQSAHRIDDQKLKSVLPSHPYTPVHEVLGKCLNCSETGDSEFSLQNPQEAG